MTAQIFLSHSSMDQKVARTICTALEARGLKCWTAERDVSPGENYQESIVKAIRAARVMVLVFTTNANNSDEIKKELALASQNRLTIIPVRVEDVVPNEAFAYEFATRQWIDLFADWESEVDRLCSRIAAIVSIGDDAHSAKAAVESNAQSASAPAAAAVDNDIVRLNSRILTTSKFTIGLLLNDVGIFFVVLAVFFNLAGDYGAGLPAFIAGLPFVLVGGGIVEQYERLRIAGAVLCGLLLAVMIGILVAPAEMLTIDLNKSSVSLLGIFVTTSAITLLTSQRTGTGNAAQTTNQLQVFMAKLLGVLSSSKWFLLMAATIYAVPTWVIFFDITQSPFWLVGLIVCQVLLAAILFIVHWKRLGMAPRDSARA